MAACASVNPKSLFFFFLLLLLLLLLLRLLLLLLLLFLLLLLLLLLRLLLFLCLLLYLCYFFLSAGKFVMTVNCIFCEVCVDVLGFIFVGILAIFASIALTSYLELVSPLWAIPGGIGFLGTVIVGVFGISLCWSKCPCWADHELPPGMYKTMSQDHGSIPSASRSASSIS